MSNAEVEFSILAGSGAPVRAFRQGEIIFREGDPATELYVIKSGRVDISTGNRLLATLEENGIFGEMALIDDHPRMASAVAEEETACVIIGKERLSEQLDKAPRGVRVIVNALLGNIRAMGAELAEATVILAHDAE